MNLLELYSTQLLIGTLITLGTWVAAGLGSLCIGLFLGIISCHYLSHRWVIALVRIYTFIAKGIPAYVQILIAYFVLPPLLYIHISSLTAALIALIFCSSGYTTEIIRAGINTISRGQWQACLVLGYSLRATLVRIIMPQAMRAIVAPLFGEWEQLLKSTSLLATIGITELTRTGMNIISRELTPIPVYIAIALIYLLISAFLQLFLVIIERRYRHD